MVQSNFPRRGDVHWTELEPTRGAEIRKTRPCLVVTSNIFNRRRGTVVIVPISTTSPKDFPLHVSLPSVSTDSQAVIDQIRVVDKGRLGDWKASVSDAEMESVIEAMKIE